MWVSRDVVVPVLVGIHLVFLFSGCASKNVLEMDQGHEVGSRMAEEEKECFNAGRRSSMEEIPSTADSLTSYDLKQQLSERQYIIVAATGLLPFLQEHKSLKARNDKDRDHLDLARLKVDSQINRRLMLAMADAASASGKVRCERSRAKELADSIERNKDRRKDRKTVASIFAGAATNVLTGIFTIVDLSLTGGAAGIAGGVTQYMFRGLAVDEEVQVEFRHPHNYLHDVWEGPGESDLFPTSVWQFLVYKKEDGTSLREEIKEQWRQGRRIKGRGDDIKDRYDVLFGEGGTYNIDQLRARSAMLELLASNIELMQDELDRLIRDVLI